MASEREKIIALARDHAAQLALVAVQMRVKASAIPDFMRRGFEAFDHEPFTEQAAQAWGKSQQMYASHLFEPREQQATGTPAERQPEGNRQDMDYSKISNPTDRLTAWREHEAARAQQGQSL